MIKAKALTSAMLMGVAFLTTGCFDKNSSSSAAASGSASNSKSSVGATTSLSLQGSPSSTVVAGSSYYFQPVAQGASSSASFSISGKPNWAMFSSSTGQLTGSPQADQVGSYGNITITVNDGSGTSTIGPFNINVVSTDSASNVASTSGSGSGSGSGSATLVWDVPTVNTNGSTLQDLAGYKIYYGNSDTDLSRVIDVASASATSYVIEQLGSGTYFFAISAYNRAGLESAMKMVGSKQIG